MEAIPFFLGFACIQIAVELISSDSSFPEVGRIGKSVFTPDSLPSGGIDFHPKRHFNPARSKEELCLDRDYAISGGRFHEPTTHTPLIPIVLPASGITPESRVTLQSAGNFPASQGRIQNLEIARKNW
jgi:hypothetical protein